MRAYVALFVVAACVSALLTPLMRSLALRFGAISCPGGRNINARVVPRYGGIAICLSFLVALVALYCSEASTAATIHAQGRRLVGLVVGGVGLCAVGAVDDTRRLRAIYKLYAQIAAALVAFACGFRIDSILLPLVVVLPMGAFALPVTVAWIVGITNAINLIDGLDGLAAGVVFFAAITNLVVAHITGATFVAIAMSSVLGSVVGFLLFNFNPARIFMGDSGSYFLGFLLGTMSLMGASQRASTAVSLLVPILALGLPIVDTLFSILRRLLERRPLFSPDRGHIHHRLLDMGITHRRAVLILYGICVLLTAAAIAVCLGRIWTVGVALLLGSLAIVGVTRFSGYFQQIFVITRQRARLRSADTERMRQVIPDALTLFVAARTEDEVWDTLRDVLLRTSIATAELSVRGDPTDSAREIARWGSSPDHLMQSPNAVSVNFPIGPDSEARAALRFRWRSQDGEVSPQTEVLMQVLVDVIARALRRVGSRFAPRTVADSSAARDANIERLSGSTLDAPGPS